ncbi:MAG TPA: nicotinamide-nucleotide amidohydrolase family protein [Acidimicrobiia bacterium]
MRARDLAARFAFGFGISVAAGIIVQTAGPVFGGMFLAFPAILPATTTLLERRNGLAQAAADVRGATVGALGMVAFASVAWVLLRRISPGAALAAAMLTWIATCVAIYAVMRAVVHVLHEHHYLPEIPITEAAAVIDALEARSLTIAAAESCTGGLVASFLASVPDASQVFRGAVVAYDNEVKVSQLGVDATIIDRHGPVSAAVAAAMSQGVRAAIHADVGIGITGLTGSATDGKPAGLTFISVTLAHSTIIRRYTDDFGPGRNDERAVRMAFKLVMDALRASTDDDHNVAETVDH